MAIARLSEMTSAVDRLVLAKRFDVERWLKPAYIELCKRDSSLTLAENTRLGMEDATLLANARAAMRGSIRGYNVSDTVIDEYIEKAKHQMRMKPAAA